MSAGHWRDPAPGALPARHAAERVNAKAGQRGFMLVGLLAGVAITAVLGAVLVNSLYQLNRAGSDGGAHLAVATAVRTSTRWLARDAQRAETTTVPDGGAPVSTGAFNWTDEIGPHSCSYALDGTNLARTCDGATVVAARGVSSLQFTRSGGLVTAGYTITATGRPDVSETVVLNLSIRSD